MTSTTQTQPPVFPAVLAHTQPDGSTVQVDNLAGGALPSNVFAVDIADYPTPTELLTAVQQHANTVPEATHDVAAAVVFGLLEDLTDVLLSQDDDEDEVA